MLFLLEYQNSHNIHAENRNTRLLKYLQFFEPIFFPSVAALCYTLPDSFPEEEVIFPKVVIISARSSQAVVCCCFVDFRQLIWSLQFLMSQSIAN